MLCAIGVVLGMLQNRFRTAGTADPVSRTLQTAIFPVVKIVDSAADSIGNSLGSMGQAAALRAQNERIQRELNAVRHYLDSAEAQTKEIDRLRATVGLNPQGRQPVYAEIIGYVPYDNRVTISAGSNQGVKPNLAVVTGEGLLGVVSTVTSATSQVTLVTSSSVKVGGIIQGSPVVPGLVRGLTSQKLVMDLFESFDVRTGSEVVTTGYSEYIPRGIRIGTVTEYFKSEEYGTRQAFVLPAAQVGLQKEVAVLK